MAPQAILTLVADATRVIGGAYMIGHWESLVVRTLVASNAYPAGCCAHSVVVGSDPSDRSEHDGADGDRCGSLDLGILTDGEEIGAPVRLVT